MTSYQSEHSFTGIVTMAAERQGIPLAGEVQSIFIAQLDMTKVEPLDEFARAIADLHACNLFQWQRESEIRDPGLEASEVVQLKSDIDRSNKQRSRLIGRLDEVCAARLRLVATGVPDGYINSETIGQLVDRLSILTLKIFFVRSRADQDDASYRLRASCEAHACQLEKQRLYVAACYDRFLQHLSRGSGSMLVSRQFKFYEDADL